MTTDKPRPQRGVKRIVMATVYSLAGLKISLQTGPAFRQEIAFFIIAVAGIFWLEINRIEAILLVLCHGAVLLTELLNSAIEAVVDLVSTDYHELAKKAKDSASAAVFVSILLTIFMWIMALKSIFNW